MRDMEGFWNNNLLCLWHCFHYFVQDNAVEFWTIFTCVEQNPSWEFCQLIKINCRT